MFVLHTPLGGSKFQVFQHKSGTNYHTKKLCYALKIRKARSIISIKTFFRYFEQAS